MRLTKYTDYGLRVLMYLGVRTESLSTIREISAGYDISRNHVMKVVNALARHGYVETVRGKGGGLRLARSAQSIVVGDVVRQMESDFELVECFGAGNRCSLTSCCILPAAIDKALSAFLSVLDDYTLADLIPARGGTRRILRAM